jgi:hypothetical protein
MHWFPLMAFGIVVLAVYARYIRPGRQTTIEEMKYLLANHSLVCGEAEVRVSDGHGKFDRFPLRDRNLSCIYVRESIHGEYVESLDITVLSTGARLWMRFRRGDLYAWGFQSRLIGFLRIKTERPIPGIYNPAAKRFLAEIQAIANEAVEEKTIHVVRA